MKRKIIICLACNKCQKLKKVTIINETEKQGDELKKEEVRIVGEFRHCKNGHLMLVRWWSSE